MSGYRNSAGVDFDSLFDADTVGDGAVPPGYLLNSGAPLKYAHIKYGSKGPDVGYRDSAGTDLSNYWASRGTAVYNLGFHGKNYSVQNSLRGSATIKLYMLNDGTWQIHKITSSEVGYDAGTWLPAGDSVANWSCNMGVSQTGSSIGNASHSTANSAPGVTALTATQTASATSQAILVTTQDVSNGQITVILYRLGVQRSVSTFNYQTSAFGN